MAYSKHTWTDDEVITKEKLNNIEEGIENIELTPGPAGETGPQGPKGADAVINKLDKVDALTAESASTQDIATAFNNLIADLKAKGYMNIS